MPEQTSPVQPEQTERKGQAKPLQRTKRQKAVSEKQRKKTELQEKNARLAQIVNLHIAGFSLAQIGESIGASAEEVDRMLSQDAARYVRNQPALRTYVRNWISDRYMKMIEADWDQATDAHNPHKLEHQDRVDRFLKSMAKLHGADAPTQSEVKIEAAPEAVESLVNALAAGQGLGYDDTIFDVVDAEVISDAVEQTHGALEVSGNAVEEAQPDDEEF